MRRWRSSCADRAACGRAGAAVRTTSTRSAPGTAGRARGCRAAAARPPRLRRQPPQVAAERVDHAVERLERHRLALVAAALEHDRGAFCARSSRKRSTSAVLPMPDVPCTNTTHRRTLVGRVPDARSSSAQLARRGRRTARRARGRIARRGRPLGALPSARSDRRAVGRVARVALQQPHAQRRRASAARPRPAATARADRPAASRAATSMYVPSNGTSPVSASYSITPSAYQSLASVDGAPAACSGDMYAGVPITPRLHRAVRVARALGGDAEVEHAPRGPSAVTSTLSGLRSRCSLPAACSAISRLHDLAQHRAQAVVVAQRRREQHLHALTARARAARERSRDAPARSA